VNLSRITERIRLRRTVAAASAVAGALLVAACSSGQTAGSTSTAKADAVSGGSASYTVTYGNIGTTAGLTGPIGFADSQGVLSQWLKPYGITLKVADFANGPLLTAAMVGGSVDLGTLGDTPALVAESQGLQAKLIAQPTVGQVAWVIAQPSIKSLSQLTGKTVARQDASYLDRYVQGLLQQNNLLSSVKLVPMLQAQFTPAFEAGSLDAIVIPPTAWPAIQAAGQKAGKAFNIVAKSETTPTLQGTSLTIISNKELAAHPDLPAAYNAIRVKALQYATAHAAAYYAWGAKQGNTTAAIEQQTAPLRINPAAVFTSAGISQLQGTLNFLVSEKEAKSFSIQDWELQSSN
jgi:ABC-type taurine transport system substrate-binding protein